MAETALSRRGAWAWVALAGAAAAAGTATVLLPGEGAGVDVVVHGAGVPPPGPRSARGSHPDLDWTGLLRKALAGADRLEVWSVDPEGEEEEPLFAADGAEAIASLAALLEIDPAESGDFCMCSGAWRLRFLRGGADAVFLNLKHLERLWALGVEWPGEGVLTPEAREALPRWFLDRGFADISREWVRDRDETAAKDREDAAVRDAFPPGVRGLLWAGEPVRATEAKRIAGGPAIAAACCRALGRMAKSMGWNTSDWRVDRVEAAMREVTGEEFALGLETLRDDAEGLLGAGRLVFREDWLRRLPAGVRGRWAALLGEASIRGGEQWYAVTVARVLGNGDAPESRALLRRIADGEFGRGPLEDWGGGAGTLPSAAVLSLAKLGDPGAADRARRILAGGPDDLDRLAAEVAIALASGGKGLRPEHFSGGCGTVTFAALDALEATGGREGMEALVEAMAGDPAMAFDLAATFCRVTGLRHGHEGHARRCQLDQCLAWWKGNGAAFLEGAAKAK